MTRQDQNRWNSRYLAQTGNLNPSGIVSKYAPLAPAGNALDIACGNGRNSIFLADNGFRVDAVDISDIALDRLQALGHKNINTACQDLDTWQIPENRYQLIINIRFLDRRLFPMIIRAMAAPGMLIFESFIDEKRAFCLKPNELISAFGELRIVYYEEKEIKDHGKFEQSVCLVAVKQ